MKSFPEQFFLFRVVYAFAPASPLPPTLCTLLMDSLITALQAAQSHSCTHGQCSCMVTRVAALTFRMRLILHVQ